MAEVGDLVGTYRLTALIGQGGMGTVFRAHDERLDREVAVKVLAPSLSEDESFRQRFQRESRVTAGFHHPNIVPVFDAGEWRHQLYIAMMLVEGPNLASVIARDAPMAPRRVAGIVSQVASALDAAHRVGIVHRDVKPANILLLDRPSGGGTEHAYLVDFGLTRSTSAMTQMTRVGTFVGTLDYVAPEQLQGDQIDGRADQYALACTTFQMLAGAPPFKRESEVALISAHLYTPPPMLSDVRPDLPSGVSWVLTRAMAKEPDARFRSTEEFAEALSQAVTGVIAQPNTIAAGMVPAPAARGVAHNYRPEAAGRNYQAVAIGMGAILLALVVGLGAVFALGWGAPGATGSTSASPPGTGAPGSGVTPTPTGASTPTLPPTLAPTPTLIVTAPPATSPPFPWQVFISASATTLQAGDQVTISVTLNAPFADAAAAGLALQVTTTEARPGYYFNCPPDSDRACHFVGRKVDVTTTYVATIGPPGGPPIDQNQVTVTWLPATPAPTIPTIPGAPVLASTSWDVTHAFPYFSYGSTDHYEFQQNRTYTLDYYSCISAYDCTAEFQTNIGSSPTYYWNGSTWDSGPTNYVGGRKCYYSAGGYDVEGGYDVQQTVSVSPTDWDEFGRITEMQGQMVLTATTTATGYAYGCSDYQIVYSTTMRTQ